jgi:hypothetical protein
MSNFDSPIIPPVGMVGFDAEKKKGARARMASHNQ